MDTRLRSNAAAGPFSSQPSGLRVFWLAALSLIGRRPQRVFSLFASRIQPKYAAAPLNQSRTWCTSCNGSNQIERGVVTFPINLLTSGSAMGKFLRDLIRILKFWIHSQERPVLGLSFHLR